MTRKPLATYEISDEVPVAGEYIHLRLAAGMTEKSAEAAERGLPASLYAVCVRLNGMLVGMGRVIGDGGLNFEVVDIAVHPDHQRRGLGSRIMESIMNWLHANAPPSSFVCLIADDDAPALYRKFGFEFTAPKSVGMAYRFQLPRRC